MSRKVKVSEVVNLQGKLLGYAYKNPKRQNRNEIVGVFVGVMFGSQMRCGWSKTNLSAGDSFDIKFGFEKAHGRIQTDTQSYTQHLENVPQGKFRHQFHKFQTRCFRYFKTGEELKDNLGDCQVV